MQVLVWADQQSSLTCTIIIVIINRQRHCHQAMDAKSALLCMRPYHQSPTLAILHKTNLLCNLGPYRGYPYMTSAFFSYFLIPHHFLYICVITFIYIFDPSLLRNSNVICEWPHMIRTYFKGQLVNVSSSLNFTSCYNSVPKLLWSFVIAQFDLNYKWWRPSLETPQGSSGPTFSAGPTSWVHPYVTHFCYKTFGQNIVFLFLSPILLMFTVWHSELNLSQVSLETANA